MFNHARDVLITGGTFSAYGDGYPVGLAFDKLQTHVAPGAFHNSGERFDPPKCHPQTRVAVLERLMNWVTGRTADAHALIMWMHGAAGAGKSAIAQTFAEMCHELGLLLGSFFFARLDSKRNHAGHLIPTLAYQIALLIPAYRINLENAIAHDPLILSKSLETQLMTLIVKPLRPLIGSGYFDDWTSSPRLIIIDGLDECNDPKVQSAIIDTIAKVLRGQHVPFMFLIASRPETAISNKFASATLAEFHLRLPLDDAELHTDDDIRRFLEDEFERIRTEHPRKHFIPSSWPPPDVIETLIKKSSGQFIFASVAMKHVSSVDDLPTRGLETILGLRPPRRGMPFAELDALYIHILSSAKFQDEALRILASFIFRPYFEVVNVLECYLCLGDGDTEVFLADLAAVVSIIKGNLYLSLQHASLRDFLVDHNRSGSFYLDPAQYHTQYAIEWLTFFVTPETRANLSNPAYFNRHKLQLASIHNARVDGLFKHLSLANPTPELREAILRCSLRDIARWSNTSHKDYEDNAVTEIHHDLSCYQCYLEVIHNLKFDDIEQIYAGLVTSFDDMLVEECNMWPKDSPAYTFLSTAVTLSKYQLRLQVGERKNWHVELNHVLGFNPSKQKPIICFLDSITDDCQISGLSSLHLLVDLIQNQQPFPDQTRDSKKNAFAAVSCLQHLFNHTMFSIPCRLTSTSTHTRMRRNLPWKWRNLVPTKALFRSRCRFSPLFAYRVKYIATAGDTKLRFPYPKFRRKYHEYKLKMALYYMLFHSLPEILEHADKSAAVLEFVDRGFPNTLPRFSYEKILAKRQIEAYVARTFGQNDADERA